MEARSGLGEPADWVLHVDLDQFLAAVEVLRRPELAGRPVVVGGDGNPRRPRQVVATASYEARAVGVHSGMPMGSALRTCPDCVFLAHDRPVYEAASTEVMAVLRSFPVTVEVWGWDEAFVGVRSADPWLVATEFARRRARTDPPVVRDRHRRDAIVGEDGHPRRQAGRDRLVDPPGMGGDDGRRAGDGDLGDRGSDRPPPRRVRGAHRPTTRPGRHDAVLAGAFGPRIGPSLKILGLGGDTSPLVDEPWIAKGRSKETTFTEDLTDPERIAAEVDRLAREVTESVVADGRSVTHVAVKVRTKSFYTRTKISKLPSTTTDPTAVARTAAVVLGRFEDDVIGRPIRLLGVHVVLDVPG